MFSLDGKATMCTSRSWKIEKLTEVFPGKEKLFEHYWDLPERELAIVAGAGIDAGLAEFLQRISEESRRPLRSFWGSTATTGPHAGHFLREFSLRAY